eukprot:gene23603-biopygen5834
MQSFAPFVAPAVPAEPRSLVAPRWCACVHLRRLRHRIRAFLSGGACGAAFLYISVSSGARGAALFIAYPACVALPKE